MSDFKSIPGGICAPKGFSAAGVHCGIRHNHSKLDLALIKADVAARARAAIPPIRSTAHPSRWTAST